MTVELRLLGAQDRDALTRLLAAQPDATMFFRSNLAQAGIDYTGAYFSAQYIGAAMGGQIRAVIAHCWNDMLLVHAPGEAADLVPQLAERVVAISGRPISGLLGGWPQITAIRAALQLEERPTNMCSRDLLFALDLAELRVPALLKTETDVHWRPAEDRDIEQLVGFRIAYHRELLGTPDSSGLPDQCRDEVMSRMDGNTFVLVDIRSEEPASCSSFNARVPDTVQVGGVFTPPALRGRGYGRAVVAGSLLAVRDQGVARSILFTGRDNPAAQAAYRALGYQVVGDYGLVLFRE